MMARFAILSLVIAGKLARAIPASNAITCPTAECTNFTGHDGKVFTIKCDAMYVGGDFVGGTSLQPDMEFCINACSSHQYCVGVSYRPDTKVCQVKARVREP